MPWFGRCPWRLVLALGLLGLMAGPLATRAVALGCHAEDRPTLGLDHDNSGDASYLTDHIQRLIYPDERAPVAAPRLGRPPCSQDLSGTPPSPVIPPPVDLALAGTPPPHGPGERLPGDASRLRGPNPPSRAPERPPRLAAITKFASI